MKFFKKPVLFLLSVTAFILLLFLLMQPLLVIHFREYIDILFPQGLIALEERNLLLIIQGVMLLVIVPVYILTFVFSWRYRVGNKNAKYEPDLVDSTLLEYIWWGVPCVLTLVVAVLTWVRTEQLDPYKPIPSDKKAITIQVVALQWRWLFIYPEEGIASINFLQIPRNVPIRFEITADAPMNSFWVPSLGGQIYAMPAMRTELNLIANEAGDFRGSSANLSGEGFAHMHFIVRASSDEDYLAWVQSMQRSEAVLDYATTYSQLALPSVERHSEGFLVKDRALVNRILMKFMMPPEK